MTTFKVMTWNLENLYRAGTKFGPDTQLEYEKKLDTLAEVILRLNPDVLAVQEVGNPDAFDDLVKKLEGRYPHHQLSAHPDRRGMTLP